MIKNDSGKFVRMREQKKLVSEILGFDYGLDSFTLKHPFYINFLPEEVFNHKTKVLDFMKLESYVYRLKTDFLYRDKCGSCYWRERCSDRDNEISRAIMDIKYCDDFVLPQEYKILENEMSNLSSEKEELEKELSNAYNNFEIKLSTKNREIERLEKELEESSKQFKNIWVDETKFEKFQNVAIQMKNKDNANTKFFKRSSKEVLKFKEDVLKRDKVCQCCGSAENLEVHHINPFKTHNHEAADVNNGIVLCKDCHKQYHSEYGVNGYTNNQLTFSKFLRDYGSPINCINSENVLDNYFLSENDSVRGVE